MPETEHLPFLMTPEGQAIISSVASSLALAGYVAYRTIKKYRENSKSVRPPPHSDGDSRSHHTSLYPSGSLTDLRLRAIEQHSESLKREMDMHAEISRLRDALHDLEDQAEKHFEQLERERSLRASLQQELEQTQARLGEAMRATLAYKHVFQVAEKRVTSMAQQLVEHRITEEGASDTVALITPLLPPPLPEFFNEKKK